MKKIAFLLFAFFVFALATPLVLLMTSAHASDTSMCYVVSDPDQRSFCLAKSRHDPSTCYAIQRADLRAQCLAEVRK